MQLEFNIKGTRKSKPFISKLEAQGWSAQQELALNQEANRKQSVNYLTFREIIILYVHDVSSPKRGAPGEEIRLKKLMKLVFTSLPMDEITTEYFVNYRDSELKLGIQTESVRRELVLFSGVLDKAIKEWCFFWLRKSAQRYEVSEACRTARRLSTEVEIEKLLWVLSYVEGQTPNNAIQRIAVAFLFAIETAMRDGEIANLRKRNIDFDEQVALPRRTKNGKDRKVPLSLRAIELLTVLPKSSDETIFDLTDKGGRSPGERTSYLFSKAKKQALIDDVDLLP